MFDDIFEVGAGLVVGTALQNSKQVLEGESSCWRYFKRVKGIYKWFKDI